MFLSSGRAISEKIKFLIDQKNSEPIRFAVAFWGEGSEKFLENKQYQIICDLASGACNPKVIRNILGCSPGSIKMRSNFHAKVVVTSHGAVVSSANMSINGLGRGEGVDSGTEEAGYFVAGSDREYPKIVKWFDMLWKSPATKSITEEALQAASNTWMLGLGDPQVRGSSGCQPDGIEEPEVPEEPEELLGMYNKKNLLRSVNKSVLEQCMARLPGVDSHLCGKFATFAVHLMLNAKNRPQQYQRNTSRGPEPVTATNEWIDERINRTDSKKGMERVHELLEFFADREKALPTHLDPIREAAEQALNSWARRRNDSVTSSES